MRKDYLREQGYSEVEEIPRPVIINTLWAVFTVAFIIGTFIGIFFVIDVILGGANIGGGNAVPDDDILILIIKTIGRAIGAPFGRADDTEAFGYLIFMTLTLLLYLCLKLFMTILFCYKPNNIQMKLLEGKGIPICGCKEALRVWQTLLIYFVPFILMYGFYVFLFMRYQGSSIYAIFMVIFFIMMIFMALDFTLIIYVLRLRITKKIDYISIDQHIFRYTLFKKSYVSFSNKKAKKIKNK